MTTYLCSKCLKKTIEDAELADLPATMVLATSACGAVGGGDHAWTILPQPGVSAPSEISTLSCALSQLTCLIANSVEKLDLIANSMEKLEKLDLIVEQTRPRKAKKNEAASQLHSDVRKNFFQCLRVSFSSELPRFKRFDDPTGNKSAVLLAEVVRYVGVMRTRYLAGQVKEVEYVQPEIRDQFWPNTRSCLRNSRQCTMKHEKEYSFKVDNDAMEAIITGKTDHVIQPLDNDFASATLEDKAICLQMTAQEVSQAVTQVNFEVGQMEQFLNYAPVEYVGLLQNGPVWIAVLRKIDRGKVLWTYVQASPAFEVNEDSNQRTATEINHSSCVEIARLIEHAYCTADKITEEIMYPERRPMNMMYTINEYQHQSDDDEDEEDQEQGNSKESGPLGKVGGAATLAPAKQSATQEQQKKQQQNKSSADRKKSHSDGNISSQNHEYFILPLSLANVARHAAGVC